LVAAKKTVIGAILLKPINWQSPCMNWNHRMIQNHDLYDFKGLLGNNKASLIPKPVKFALICYN
jgi:hypothetical protein